MGRLLIAASAIALAATFLYAYFYSGYPGSSSLPLLTALTLGRITLVFLLSLGVGVGVGVLAATNRSAGKVIIPIFDILQSVPILGYFPILLVGLIAVFPGLLGVELGVLVLLFTAMEWSIFFGVVGAVKGIPPSVEDAAKGFGVKGFAHFRNVVFPAAVPAILSASTLAWNDGWTFDIAAEYLTYGGHPYSVTGLGSYIFQASSVTPNLGAAWLGLLIMGEMVVLTNQLVWHRLTERAAAHRSRLGFHVPERVVHPLRAVAGTGRRFLGLRFRVETLQRARLRNSFSTKLVVIVFVAVLFGVSVAVGLSSLVPALGFVSGVFSGQDLVVIPLYTLFTLGRMTAVYLLCLLVSLGVALVAAQRKGFTKYFFVFYDTGRAIPYLALFPPLFATLVTVMPGEIGLEISSFFLLFMGMFWYIIFNVVTAATFLPTELREVTSVFGIQRWKMVRNVLIPAIMPAIITGSILAWGGGWNVVIYSEYVTQPGHAPYVLAGLGSLLDQAAAANNSALVFLYLFVMSGIVILLGRLVWRRLLKKVERRGLELS